MAGLFENPHYQRWQLKKLNKQAMSVCRLVGIPETDGSELVSRSLLHAIEHKAYDIMSFAASSLLWQAHKMRTEESGRKRRETRWGKNPDAKREISDDERMKKQALIKKATAQRWAGHKVLKKHCEHCAQQFDAVNSEGATDKRRRFCSRSCASKHAVAKRATVAAAAAAAAA
jgi:hypothetical protein